MRLLLASSSTVHGRGYLDHLEEALDLHYERVRRILFVPFALADAEGYAARARDRFARIGKTVDSLHERADVSEREDVREDEALARVRDAEAFFVGGGNTFRLLAALARRRLLGPIRERVLSGAPYGGASAGSNLAGPTIRTTNDMPIVWPESSEALALVPFQINPHYLDPDPASTHMGETREERIRQFHEEAEAEPENRVPVVGLRETSWLVREDASLLLRGPGGARLFRPGRDAMEYGESADLSFLLRRNDDSI
jgi:dipeptidase E